MKNSGNPTEKETALDRVQLSYGKKILIDGIAKIDTTGTLKNKIKITTDIDKSFTNPEGFHLLIKGNTIINEGGSGGRMESQLPSLWVRDSLCNIY